MHFATKKQGCCTKQKLRTTTLPDSTNPHELVCAALVCSATRAGESHRRNTEVSMPHAAFYVVQLRRSQPLSRAGREGCFGKSSIFCAVSPLWGGIFTEKTRRQSASSLVRRRVAPKWKIATVECGFAASPSHFPLFAPCLYHSRESVILQSVFTDSFYFYVSFTSSAFGRIQRF